MSAQFLNNVISSIGNGGQNAASAQTTVPPVSRPALPNRIPNVTNTLPAASGRADVGLQKRKADSTLGGSDGVKAKVARIEANGLSNRPTQPAVPAAATRKPQSVEKTAPLPYKGTVRPTTSTSVAQSRNATIPVTKSPTPATPAVSSAPFSSALSRASAPKRGYAAILERAKAQAEAQKAIGTIKHKPVEKMSKNERLALQAEVSTNQKRPLAKDGKLPQSSRSKSAELPDVRRPDLSKDKKKPVVVGYKGTMRPAPAEPSYKGTMRPQGVAPSKQIADRKPGATNSRVLPGRAGPSKPGQYGGYASWSDVDDEGEAGQEEEGFDSGSSDMEAGLDDVYEEERRAERIAKKEDEEALQLENELKRQKLDRKRKLEQMAATAAKQRKKY
ncbi:hypothetical protein LTR66_007113 [Elasticomyces elasticus]|nr:hypothetical protein LTR66_007113 [Elasticomyces elasticus]